MDSATGHLAVHARWVLIMGPEKKLFSLLLLAVPLTSRIAVPCATATPVRNHTAPSRESHGLHIKLNHWPRLGSSATSRVHVLSQNTIGMWSKFLAFTSAHMFYRVAACRFCCTVLQVCCRLHCLLVDPARMRVHWGVLQSGYPREVTFTSWRTGSAPKCSRTRAEINLGNNKQYTTRTERSVWPVTPWTWPREMQVAWQWQ